MDIHFKKLEVCICHGCPGGLRTRTRALATHEATHAFRGLRSLHSLWRFFFCSSTGLKAVMSGPHGPHNKYKHAANHDFWYRAHIGFWRHIVRSSCLSGLGGTQNKLDIACISILAYVGHQYFGRYHLHERIIVRSLRLCIARVSMLAFVFCKPASSLTRTSDGCEKNLF